MEVRFPGSRLPHLLLSNAFNYSSATDWRCSSVLVGFRNRHVCIAFSNSSGSTNSAPQSRQPSRPRSSPADVLRFLIDDRKTNQRAVALGSGISVSTISEILGGGRALNLDHVTKLATHFKVEPGVFIPRQTSTTSKVKRGDKQRSR